MFSHRGLLSLLVLLVISGALQTRWGGGGGSGRGRVWRLEARRTSEPPAKPAKGPAYTPPLRQPKPPPTYKPRPKPPVSRKADEESWTTTSFEDEVPRGALPAAGAATSTSRTAPTAEESDREYEELGEQPGAFKSSFVSILGNPNVGKSTLMNALLGQALSIVSPKPQTTRHRILGVLTNTSYQLVFSDTPGMLLPAYRLQEAMMESVRTAAGDADIVCLVTDVYGEALVDKKVVQKLEVTGKPVVVIVNKSDLLKEGGGGEGFRGGIVRNGTVGHGGDGALSAGGGAGEGEGEGDLAALEGEARPRRRLLLRRQPPPAPAPPPAASLAAEYGALHAGMQRSAEAEARSEEGGGGGSGGGGGGRGEQREQPSVLPLPVLLSRWAQRLPRAYVVCVSAREGWGLADLQELLVALSPLGPKYFPSDTVTNRDERFFASEIIREALLLCYQDEVPYSCEVQIEAFQDKPGLTVIDAIIAVSRESQKAILIGAKGARIKELGMAARPRLEAFLDRPVYLNLRVRLDEEWRGSDEALQRFGYINNEDFG